MGPGVGVPSRMGRTVGDGTAQRVKELTGITETLRHAAAEAVSGKLAILNRDRQA